LAFRLHTRCLFTAPVFLCLSWAVPMRSNKSAEVSAELTRQAENVQRRKAGYGQGEETGRIDEVKPDEVRAMKQDPIKARPIKGCQTKAGHSQQKMAGFCSGF